MDRVWTTGAIEARAWDTREAVATSRLFRPNDWLLTLMCALPAGWLLLFAHRFTGALESGVAYGLLASGPVALRLLARHVPRARAVATFCADVWLIPVMAFGHCYFGPVVDSINPRLYDAKLAWMDARLFGAQPGVLLESRVPPLGTEILMFCYYTYFLWPAIVGLWLRFGRDRRAFDEFTTALGLFFFANFLFYVAVPAIGPRFFLADAFEAPLRGVWLTPYLDGLMRAAPFNRDCFPSGHTGVTLLVGVFAFRYVRKVFWVMLPIGSGLIAATIVGRFHYAIDLICAVPLMLAAVSAAGLAWRPRPALSPARRPLPAPEAARA